MARIPDREEPTRAYLAQVLVVLRTLLRRRSELAELVGQLISRLEEYWPEGCDHCPDPRKLTSVLAAFTDLEEEIAPELEEETAMVSGLRINFRRRYAGRPE